MSFLGLVPAEARSYVDRTVVSGLIYCYRLAAYNTAGNSPYTPEACAVAPTIPTRVLTVVKAGTGSGAVTSSPSGISCGVDCDHAYASSTTVALTAAPAAGSSFIGWSGACTGTSPCVVILDAAKSVTATFTRPSYAFTVVKGGTGTGTVTSNPAGLTCGIDCTELFPSGTVVTLTAAPAAGSTFTGWSGACAGTGTCAVTVSAAKSVTATFALVSPDF